MKRRRVGGIGLEVERGQSDERLEQDLGVVERERCVCGYVRALPDQRQRLTSREFRIPE
jgi:hypothetical protein